MVRQLLRLGIPITIGRLGVIGMGIVDLVVVGQLAHAAARIALVIALSIPFHLLFIASSNFLEALQKPTPGAVAMLWRAHSPLTRPSR